MFDDPAQPSDISLTRLFPWLRLSRAVGLSFDPKKLFLAVLGLLALHAGWALLKRPPSKPPVNPFLAGPLLPSGPTVGTGILSENSHILRDLAEPGMVVLGPFLEVFSSRADETLFLHGLLAAAWAVAVWGIVGGAIARIAVVQAATGERTGMFAALRFSLGKVLALVGGPLTPLLGAAIVASPCLLFGLLYRSPGSFGEVMAGALAVIPLVLGLLMTFILVGVAAGWPLMIAAVATEAQDGFDALSRAYAYIYQRPGRYAAYIAVAAIGGGVGYVVVALFAHAVYALALWALSWTAPRPELELMFRAGPATAGTLAARLHGFWLGLLRLLVHGWLYAYFWSAAVLIYALVRHDVDGTDWYDVALPPAVASPLEPDLAPAEPVGAKSLS